MNVTEATEAVSQSQKHLEHAQAQLEKAQAAQSKARTEFDRLEALPSLTSKEATDFENARRAVRSAEAEVVTAGERVTAAGAGCRGADKALEAAKDDERARLAARLLREVYELGKQAERVLAAKIAELNAAAPGSQHHFNNYDGNTLAAVGRGLNVYGGTFSSTPVEPVVSRTLEAARREYDAIAASSPEA